MDRETVLCMSRVAQILARCKVYAGDHVREHDLEAYVAIREMLHDCQEILALHCETAPIRLIAGQVDEIVANLACSKDVLTEGV